jgi:hypothetical protein
VCSSTNAWTVCCTTTTTTTTAAAATTHEFAFFDGFVVGGPRIEQQQSVLGLPDSACQILLARFCVRA